MPKPEKDINKQIKNFLPLALRRALNSYERFCENKDQKIDADFKAHHDACKVAIAHVELLVKLAERTVPKDSQDTQDKELAKLIMDAALEVKNSKACKGD